MILDENQITYPHDVNLEQMVLGHLFIDNSHFYKVVSFLKPEHFFEPVHQRIYEAFTIKAQDGQVTPMTLKAIFDQDPALKDSGGGKYLGALMSMAIMPIEVVGLAVEVAELSRRRDLINLSISILKQAQDLSLEKDVGAITSELISGGLGVLSDTKTSHFQNGLQVVDEIISEIGAANQYYSTGIRQLDEVMEGGLYPGYAYAFGGKPKTGKTVLGCTLAVNLARQGVSIGYINAEMQNKSIAKRMICRLAGILPSVISRARGDDEDLKKALRESAADGKVKNIHMCYEQSIEFENLKQRLHYLVHNKGIKGFVIDYWQIIEGVKKNQSEALHLQTVAQWLGGFCKKENVFGVILCQLNDDGSLFASRGINRAVEQLYHINRSGTDDEFAWLHMKFSRYCEAADVGSEYDPAFKFNPSGPYFEEI